VKKHALLLAALASLSVLVSCDDFFEELTTKDAVVGTWSLARVEDSVGNIYYETGTLSFIDDLQLESWDFVFSADSYSFSLYSSSASVMGEQTCTGAFSKVGAQYTLQSYNDLYNNSATSATVTVESLDEIKVVTSGTTFTYYFERESD